MEAWAEGEIPSFHAFLRSVSVKPGEVGSSLCCCFALIRSEGFKLLGSACARSVLFPVAYHVMQLYEEIMKLLPAFAPEAKFKQTTYFFCWWWFVFLFLFFNSQTWMWQFYLDGINEIKQSSENRYLECKL